MNQWILPSLGALLLWGLWSFLPKIITQYISPRSAVVFEVSGGLVVALLVLFFMNNKPDMHPVGVVLAVITGMLGFAGALCFLYAASKGPISLVTVVSALYPVIAILLGVYFFNESFTLKQGLGIIMGIGAVILLVT